MGQLVGRMPKTWQDLMEERDRVLHWSCEVLARVDDNINNEEAFLMDYDNKRIREKVNRWISEHRIRRDPCLRDFLDKSRVYRERINEGVTKIATAVMNKMRRAYRESYKNVRKFTNRVDLLGEIQRKIHREILTLDNSCKDNPKKFARKLFKLRSWVFDNLESSEKIMFVEKRRFDDFRKKVYDIDRKSRDECYEMLEKLIRRV
ncbi:uncharacterized protein [Fopius arisanus]|uniref:FER protein n=1 Tax=Fopius arisanus TaxID=64838 RepID=A0A0C9S1W2_9HYME|nr:PREDICTED: uncharacterized protein LOC105265455 [Fopius arisanus]XP_011301234.1 PREDICTED: uncharacterized protein LOC105265455 [Fopius arisanus]